MSIQFFFYCVDFIFHFSVSPAHRNNQKLRLAGAPNPVRSRFSNNERQAHHHYQPNQPALACTSVLQKFATTPVEIVTSILPPLATTSSGLCRDDFLPLQVAVALCQPPTSDLRNLRPDTVAVHALQLTLHSLPAVESQVRSVFHPFRHKGEAKQRLPGSLFSD